MKNRLIGLAVVLVVLALVVAGCGEGTQRAMKSFSSNFGGGLDRVLTVYDYEGEVIKTYEGRFDIHADSPGKILFDRRVNGELKRTIIHGGIVIIDEK